MGLALISIALAVMVLWVFNKISSRFGLIVKVLLAIVVLWLFVWLSPQIYYLYYWMIFDGLPFQNVIQRPPDFASIARLVTFTGDANLSNHSKGVLFWLMIASAFWNTKKSSVHD